MVQQGPFHPIKARIDSCAMVKVVAFFLGDGCFPTFNDGILIMGPYKPLRNWVDEFIPYYMEIMGV